MSFIEESLSPVLMKKVVILAGPGGVGKTTIAELVEKECNYVLLDGDREDTEFFPDGGQWLSENSDKLGKAHDKILNKVKELVRGGNKVVIDYIIFGRYLDFFGKFEDEFGDDLQIAVLFPEQNEIISRDKERTCWTTGADRIKAVYNEFEKIQDNIGRDKYIDTSGQSAKETFNKYFK